jgi:hypothetical protein
MSASGCPDLASVKRFNNCRTRLRSGRHETGSERDPVCIGARAGKLRVAMKCRQYCGMPRYLISEREDGAGFDIEVETVDGARRTMPGFATQDAAEEWIIVDSRNAAVEAPEAPGLRMQWRF